MILKAIITTILATLLLTSCATFELHERRGGCASYNNAAKMVKKNSFKNRAQAHKN